MEYDEEGGKAASLSFQLPEMLKFNSHGDGYYRK